MKKWIFFIAILFSITVKSQESQFFVGKNPELLIGKVVTPKTGKSYYNGFYKNDALTNLLFKKDYENNGDKLIGLKFIVKGTMKNPVSYKTDLVLILENEKLGTIYYEYDPLYSDMFLLDVVGGFLPPEGFLCTRLVPIKDKFSSKVTTRTPEQYEYSLIKVVENDTTSIYLILQSYGSTLNLNKNSLKILFSDGTVMSKPDLKISCKVEQDLKGWTYYCIFKLSSDDINTLTTKTITDYTLYIYERKINESNAFELKEYLKCMSK